MKKSMTPSLVDYVLAQRTLATRKSRKNFWLFCQLLYPEFYKDDRLYLKDLCNTLQDFYEDRIDKKILVINMPPRHGKTFTARLFVLWMFGQNPKTKIITGSYNQILSSLFAQQTRDGIMVDNENLKAEYFNDIFPEVQIKHGDAAKGFWSLDGSEEKNYLATSPGGTSTGIGANYVIVDDIIKTAEEAYNERVLDSHWEWYNNTLVQRMERPRKQILIMTRWSSNDLAGKMLNRRKNNVHQICYKAVQEDGSMLCEDIMTYDEYQDVIQEMNLSIANANYQQEPIDQKGRLYIDGFKEYEVIDMPDIIHTYAYTDTADEGDDNHMMYIFGQSIDNQAYILDVLYTKEDQSKTRDQTVEKLTKHEVNTAWFESNNGGAGYARSVREKKEQVYPTNQTVIKWFHQSKNKKSRILTNATWAMENIFFPKGWKHKWPELYQDLMSYQKQGKNTHDDAQDGLTGVVEICGNKLQTTKQKKQETYQRIKRLF